MVKKISSSKYDKDSSIKKKNFRIMKAKLKTVSVGKNKGGFMKKQMFNQKYEGSSRELQSSVKSMNFGSNQEKFKSPQVGKRKFHKHKEGNSNMRNTVHNKKVIQVREKNSLFSDKKQGINFSSKEKGVKRKIESDNIKSSDINFNLFTLKKKDRKIVRQKNKKKETYDLGKRLKVIWEDLRRDDCKPERKGQLLEEACRLAKGHVKELIFAHDTVRVIECLAVLGTEAHRALLFEELKDDVILVAKSKYAKFFLIKILRHGTKYQKNFIVKAFHSEVIQLLHHTEAAAVVEVAFNECANASERSELVQEIYGPSYRFFKDGDALNLRQIIEKNVDQKATIIQHMKEVITKLLQKSVVSHSIVHFTLHEFMLYSDQKSRSEIIESIRDNVVQMVHTKDGSRVAMNCIWHGTAKDRKAIIKSFKTHVAKIAKEEYGHMVLLALFDSVDDTKLVVKHVIAELIGSILEISQSLYGRKVLIYLLRPRDSCHFHPDIVNILKKGDNNSTSKKDSDIRRAELKQAITSPLLKLIIDNVVNCYTDNSFCFLVLTILKHSIGSCFEAYKSIADLVAEAYEPSTKSMHPIESPGSHFMLKKLIAKDKSREMEKGESFSEILINEIPKGTMKFWIHCNRGAFLLLSLLETKLPLVVQRVKEEMEGQMKQLVEIQSKGAELLLQQLKIIM